MGDKKKGIGKERLKQLLEYLKGKFDNIVEDVAKNEARIADIENGVGNTDISTIGDGTVTGAISAVNSSLSVGNGTITVKQNGTTKGTFTTNQSGDTTIELTDNNTTYSEATTSTAGLMSKSDKTKLNGIATGANNYSLPSATSSTLGGVKVTDSAAVTNSTGLALSATEKNASINGTLANQISMLNRNLNKKIQCIESNEFSIEISGNGMSSLNLTSIFNNFNVNNYRNIISLDLFDYSGHYIENLHILLPYKNFECYCNGNPGATISGLKLRLFYYE